MKYFYTSNLLLPIFDGPEIHGGDGGATTTSAPTSRKQNKNNSNCLFINKCVGHFYSDSEELIQYGIFIGFPITFARFIIVDSRLGELYGELGTVSACDVPISSSEYSCPSSSTATNGFVLWYRID